MVMSWVADAMAMTRADGDDAGEVGGWLDRAPKDETHQDHGLKGEDPGPPVSDPMRQPGHPEPVDEGRPEEIEGVDAEDEPGPPMVLRLRPSSLSQRLRLLPISTQGKPLMIPRRRMRVIRRSK